MGEWNGMCALLTCGQPEDTNEERRTPEQQRTLNVCGHQGREGGGTPHPVARAYHARLGVGWRPPNQAARSPSM